MAWRDQVALVTGGARGIGAATARLLTKHGAAVCVNYAQNAEAAESLVAEIIAAGGRAVAARADVADVAAVNSSFPMSVLVCIADSTRTLSDVRDGPAADSCTAAKMSLFCIQKP
jgi:NAD(P)-dependent dehydrogenase (short-subunit alcohol dehydrogenase family)